MVDSGSDTEEYDYEDFDLFFHVMLLPFMPVYQIIITEGDFWTSSHPCYYYGQYQ